MSRISGCPISRLLLARCGNSQTSPWKSSRTICTVARAFVPSHISQKEGEIWGTLVRGKETSSHHKLVHPSHNLTKDKSLARGDKLDCKFVATSTPGHLTNLSSRPKRSEVERSAVFGLVLMRTWSDS